MDFVNRFTTQLNNVVGVSLVNILIALAVLVIGWLLALLISRLVRTLLEKTNLDDRIAGWVSGDGPRTEGIEVARWVSTAVFWLLMLLVFIMVFQILELGMVTGALNNILTQILAYIPNLLAAGLLVLLAWVLASALKWIVLRALRAANVDEKVGRDLPEGQRRTSVAEMVATAVYWLVFLFFLPAILGALNLGGLLAPVEGMINQILAFVPNLFAAALILLVGWFAARVIRRVVTSLLAAVGVDRLGRKVGMSTDQRRMSDLLGLVVYILVLIPVIVAALNALNIDAVTQPAMNMLNTILVAIPSIFAAGLVLFLSYLLARVVAGLAETLLHSIGFDDLMARLGWRAQTSAVEMSSGAEATEIDWTPSRVVSWLVVVVVMLFALVEAFSLLGFGQLAGLMTALVAFVGQVVMGLILFGIGLYLANVAGRAIKSSDAPNANLMAWLAQGAILVFAGAMALRQMGLANSIINLAFGLSMGAIAVAAALAFGLGGREVAGRKLQQWVRTVDRGEVNVPTPPTFSPGQTPQQGPARSYGTPGTAAGGLSASGGGSESGMQTRGSGSEHPGTSREPMP